MNSIKGKVWLLPDDVDTDTIIPGRYGVLPTLKDMSKHCLEPLRPEFSTEVKEGDILVAGKNFGCGSSREQAPGCILASGVKCIIAKSFARIFYRNGINNGMFLIESPDVPEEVKEGDVIEVVLNEAVYINGKEYAIKKMPENLLKIIQEGGLVPSYRKQNEEKAAASGAKTKEV